MQRIAIQDPAYFARLHLRLQARLPMWVIYTPYTLDYPGLWVARMHVTLPAPRPTRFVITHPSGVDELRRLLPPNLTRMKRDPSDPAVVLEIWL